MRQGTVVPIRVILVLYDTPSYSAGACGIPQWIAVSFKEVVVALLADVCCCAQCSHADAEVCHLISDDLTHEGQILESFSHKKC